MSEVSEEADGIIVLIREARKSAILQERERCAKESDAFVEFVLRHTLPERAAAHGHQAVYDIIRHHPFVTDRAAAIRALPEGE